ncbi:MAG: HAD-IIB family hydrolase, partial [Myxococcota bacterium]
MVEDLRAPALTPISQLPTGVARGVEIVFTDIDDTLTRNGQLEREAYAALWDLHEAGLRVVPVTGRPAGWCDHIARMWPVDGVIGENGALALRYDRRRRRMESLHAVSPEERAQTRARLSALQDRILREVPGAGVASDQPYRMYDLAIDFCEDVAPLAEVDIERIVQLFEAEGATAKVSSIHVNGWFGSFDKLTMIRRFAGVLGYPEETLGSRAVYVGDSPNDAPA